MVIAVETVLCEQIALVEVDERGELRHHPREGDVRYLGILEAAPNVGVHAREPDLFKVLS